MMTVLIISSLCYNRILNLFPRGRWLISPWTFSSNLALCCLLYRSSPSLLKISSLKTHSRSHRDPQKAPPPDGPLIPVSALQVPLTLLMTIRCLLMLSSWYSHGFSSLSHCYLILLVILSISSHFLFMTPPMFPSCSCYRLTCSPHFLLILLSKSYSCSPHVSIMLPLPFPSCWCRASFLFPSSSSSFCPPIPLKFP